MNKPLTPLQRRVIAALEAAPYQILGYQALMHKLWPHGQFPRAYMNSCNGGPPGVAMSFGKVLNQLERMGLVRDRRRGVGVGKREIWLLRKDA